jgi:hypothetical protein
MKPDVEQVNAALRQLAEEYAEGQLSPAAYRARRRELVCAVAGQALPQQDEGEATHPGLPPVSVEAPVAPEKDHATAVAGQTAARSYRVITVMVLALAILGAAGLLWFVFRK